MTSVTGNDQPPEFRYPSVPLAYELVPASYEMVIQRLDAVDQRIQTLQAFAATLTLAVPVVSSSIATDVDFASLWFVVAMIAFAGLLAIGLIARALWRVTLVSPKELYDGWLDLPEFDFKVGLIYEAGVHFERNTAVVYRKAVAANIMIGLFFLEAMLLVTWVAAST